MISEVREDGVSYLPPPHRFEAGTPPIAEVVGLGAALEFIQQQGFAKIVQHESALMEFAETELGGIAEIKRMGPRGGRNVFAFNLATAHHSDVGDVLSEQGIAVRAGHHCCQPLMRRFSVSGSVRASFSVYTTERDIEALGNGIRKAKELLL